MPLKPRYKRPLVLSIVSTIILIPIIIAAMFIFNNVHWGMLVFTLVIYFVVIFLIFLYYGGMGKK